MQPATSPEPKAPHFVPNIKKKLFLRCFHSTDCELIKINYFWDNQYAFVNMEKKKKQYEGKGEMFVEHRIN